METPPYLVEQFAAERGISADMAKRLLYLGGVDTANRKVSEVAQMVGVSVDSMKRVARRLIIDFADYRPHARRRDKGEEVAPRLAETRAAPDGLPLFGRPA